MFLVTLNSPIWGFESNSKIWVSFVDGVCVLAEDVRKSVRRIVPTDIFY
ncbi:hypothetical protein SAMN04515674_104243 [Pseudarcicella hirudinis]|uniref:Uncharacterized protein n=1 Tax=Pseudarcicella hirudinis TaxID=1079859 RepID=A0A1I5RTW2_9BACT|nr:hypothetical protein SAMN04515674_104243 [Pseudarcicella hirudinis]